MVRAGARRLTPEPTSKVRIRKIKKVVINMDKVRRLLRVGGILVILTMANASIQALLAQTQFHLEEVQAEIQVIDHQIGWLQYELASHNSLQQMERLALNGEPNNLSTQPDGFVQLTPNLVLPPTILSIDPVSPQTPGKTVITHIYNWVSGMGRTLAEGVRD